ncbi:hypothetical protein CJF42_22305 [Pseudoalteromonas sp. NBT06-2]|uniref:two-component regulator propeller domain-containing protein n=1 Tax=Pseudoalteromonas sp. NBT06-2 TaxID=2025950 RepID=UPI000BA7D7F6|nr:two-component regulator propeller domain-containing protein [Pseudoalteromonas sp. NBT06-2]PAJ72234.1 hypothetical protein CJF42_22305 [Pseudoalteromonas sp. NBT06-2]
MPKLLLFFLYLIILLCTSHSITAKPDFFKFRHYTLSEGLSQGSAISLIQDKDGFIWIGTQDGLNRFDGYQFKVFQNENNNPHSLISNYIKALHIDETGGLWVGTTKGLHKFNKHNNTFSQYRLSSNDSNINHQYINVIINAPNNKLWIGSNNGLHFLEIEISVTSKNQQVIIHYKDNGAGLTNTNIEQVFEPFYTTLRSNGHIGLGMHVAYNHVTQRLNGNIEIDENHTTGLAYIIMLPLVHIKDV